jgi:methylmalonyl-CoA mutase cobalamin-binding subunit
VDDSSEPAIEEIADGTVQKDVDAVGLSSLSRPQQTLAPGLLNASLSLAPQ